MIFKLTVFFLSSEYSKNTDSRALEMISSRKRLLTKVTPDLHLTYSKNGGNLGLVLNDKKWKFLHKIICCGDLLESPRGGDSNR